MWRHSAINKSRRLNVCWRTSQILQSHQTHTGYSRRPSAPHPICQDVLQQANAHAAHTGSPGVLKHNYSYRHWFVPVDRWNQLNYKPADFGLLKLICLKLCRVYAKIQKATSLGSVKMPSQLDSSSLTINAGCSRITWKRRFPGATHHCPVFFFFFLGKTQGHIFDLKYFIELRCFATCSCTNL